MQMDQNPKLRAQCSSSSKTDRKTIEKKRRNQMKALYSELSVLVPNHASSSRETVSLPDQLEGATKYIRMLEAKLEELKLKKMWLTGIPESRAGSSKTGEGVNLPNIDIRVMGSTLELVLITGLNYQFMFNDIIGMLHKDGAEVVNASFSIIDNTIFHTIHSKIEESDQDYGAARISERLRKFVHDFN